MTSVNLPAVNAQSVQIYSMASCFEEELNSRFILVTPRTEMNSNESAVWWKKINCFFRVGRLKYMEFSLRLLGLRLSKRDLVYTRDILIALMFALLGHKVVYEAHQRPSLKAKLLIAILKKYNSYFVTISKALKDYFIGEFGIDDRRVLAAHDGAYHNRYSEDKRIDIKKTFSITDSKILLLHTGSLYPGRGAELFEGILSRYRNIVILHVGGSNKLIEKWRKLINSPSFIAIPHTGSTNLVSYQMSADALLFPMTRKTHTYWCCSPLKMFEYMASGTPIISTSIGSVSEVLTTENAFLFDPDDVLSLYTAIDEFISNPEMAAIKAKQARSDLVENYTWNKRAANILGFIEIDNTML